MTSFLESETGVEKFGQGVQFFDLEKYIPELIAKGLRKICICRQGQDRSVFVASAFENAQNQPTVFVEKGMMAMKNMTSAYIERYVKIIVEVPEVYVFSDLFEIEEYGLGDIYQRFKDANQSKNITFVEDYWDFLKKTFTDEDLTGIN